VARELTEFTLDLESMQQMALFERQTGVGAVDCLMTPAAAFYVVPEGTLHRVLGTGRTGLDRLAKKLGRRVEVVELSSDPERFVRGLFHAFGVEEVAMEDVPEGTRARVRVDPHRKGSAIGKGGANLNALRVLAQRHAGIAGIVLE
jgi:N utilization substance protein A